MRESVISICVQNANTIYLNVHDYKREGGIDKINEKRKKTDNYCLFLYVSKGVLL